ncbi:unnamed protein product, partial [Closterium sp. Naga37s-1]
GLASLRAVVGIKGLTSLISPTQSPIFLLFSFPSPPPSSPPAPALVRHNPEGLESLQAIVGIKGLTSLITSAAQPTTNTTTSTTTDSTSGAITKLLLKALHLTLYFLQQCPSDRPLALSSGLLTSLLQPGIVGSQDGDKRQGSGGNSGGSDGVSEPDAGNLQEELDALLATRRALIGRKMAVARGESGGGGSGGAAGAVGGGEAGAGAAA